MKYKINIFFLFSIILVLNNLSYSQDIKIGSKIDRYSSTAGFYDCSDPRYVNISVQIWGYVRFPGKYFVPENSKLVDLISYAGGLTPDAHGDKISLFKVRDDKTVIDQIDLEGLLEGKAGAELAKIPKLQAGDLIIIPGEPKLYLRDYISMITSVVSAVAAFTTLIIVSR